MRNARIPAAVLVVTLATALGAAPAAAGEVVKLLPADTEIVFSCNVKDLVTSATVVKPAALARVAAVWKKLLKETDKVALPIDALGVDLFADVARITCAGKVGSPPIKVVDGLVVLEGTFKLAKLKAAARANTKEKDGPFKIAAVGGAEVWEWSSQRKPDDKVYVVLLNPRTLLVTGNKTILADAIDQAAGKKKAELDKSLAALLEKADPRETMTCVVSPTGLTQILKDAGVPVQVRLLFPRIRKLAGESQALSAGLTLGEELKITIGMTTETPEAAAKLRRRVDRLALVAALVLSAIEDDAVRPWEDIVRSLRAKADASAVFLRGQVSPEVIEKVLKAMGL